MNARTSPSPFLIPSLDGIRGLAFFLVFMGHAGVPGIPGGFGVTVFFFLSGYLITTLLRLEVQRSERIDFKLFYLRRTLRILPPFYLTLLISVALTLSGALPGTLRLLPVLSQAFHCSNYWAIYRTFYGTASGTAVYWSLAIEEHFYAIFPAIYAALLGFKFNGRAQRTVFFLICLVVMLWRCVLVLHFHTPSPRTYLGTDTRLDSLLFGCALAVAGNPMLDAGNEEKPSTGLLLSLGGAALLLVITFVIRDDRFRETVRYSLQGIALYPVFYAAIRFPKWGFFPLFNNRALGFVGKLSYSLYLVHGMLLQMGERWLPTTHGAIRGVLALVVSMAAAWLIWILVEKPSTRLRKGLESYARPAPTREAKSTAI
ncbi:MAG: acyltransferase [Polyangiaceae bacterium]